VKTADDRSRKRRTAVREVEKKKGEGGLDSRPGNAFYIPTQEVKKGSLVRGKKEKVTGNLIRSIFGIGTETEALGERKKESDI